MLTLIALMVIAVQSAAAANQQSDYALIEQTVGQFISGIRDGNAERVRAVSNLEHGHAIWPQSRDGIRSIVSATFDELTANLQAYPGYGAPHHILSINIIGNELAVANIAAHAPQQAGDGTILEYFTLAKSEGKWEVIALIWISREGNLLADE